MTISGKNWLALQRQHVTMKFFSMVKNEFNGVELYYVQSFRECEQFQRILDFTVRYLPIPYKLYGKKFSAKNRKISLIGDHRPYRGDPCLIKITLFQMSTLSKICQELFLCTCGVSCLVSRCADLDVLGMSCVIYLNIELM